VALFEKIILRLRHTYWMIRVHGDEPAARPLADSVRDGEQCKAFVDHPASQSDRVAGRLWVHLITAMCSSA